ncbi:hypothetical protein DL96DRAFT_1634473, partial [Flagelloscypha sp. PMI_526]
MFSGIERDGHSSYAQSDGHDSIYGGGSEPARPFSASSILNDDSVPLVCDSPNDNLSGLSKSVQALGLEEDRTLFDVLLELCLLHSVCKVSHSTVDEYMRRLSQWIASYLDSSHHMKSLNFAELKGKPTFVVSGSAAVQFFGRVNYPNSNLEVYINEDHMFRVPF